MISTFLTAAFEEDDARVFLRAVEEAVKAQGVAKVAKNAGIGRGECLQNARRQIPRFDTIWKILRGMDLTFGPLQALPPPPRRRTGVAHPMIIQRKAAAKKKR